MIDDVGEECCIGALGRFDEEVNRVAIGEGVARVVDVDPDRKLGVEPAEIWVEDANRIFGDARVDKGAKLRVEKLGIRFAPQPGAVVRS